MIFYGSTYSSYCGFYCFLSGKPDLLEEEIFYVVHREVGIGLNGHNYRRCTLYKN